MPQRPFSRSASDVSARRTYEILDEPAGDGYVSLLRAAAAECATGALMAPPTLSADGRAVVEELRRASGEAGSRVPDIGAVVRFPIGTTTLEVMATRARKLYDWRAPELPDSLCLFRADGSPWLISVAGQRLGYVELTVLERVRLSHVAPAVASSLANRVARDAIFGSLERRLEEGTDRLVDELTQYAGVAANESRDVLIAGLLAWLTAEDDVRGAVAIELSARLLLSEMREPLQRYRDRLCADELTPRVLTANPVMRDRWLSRRLRLVDGALAGLAGAAGAEATGR